MLSQERTRMPRALVDLDQGNIGCWIRRCGRDLAGMRRTHIYHMPAPVARAFAQVHSQAVNTSDHMSSRDRKAWCDEESRPLRASISVEASRACHQQASRYMFAFHFGSSSSWPTGGTAASRRSQDAVTVTCTL